MASNSIKEIKFGLSFNFLSERFYGEYMCFLSSQFICFLILYECSYLGINCKEIDHEYLKL